LLSANTLAKKSTPEKFPVILPFFPFPNFLLFTSFVIRHLSSFILSTIHCLQRVPYSVITRSLRSRSIPSFGPGSPLYLFFPGFTRQKKDAASIPHVGSAAVNFRISVPGLGEFQKKA
jgi:hypothetical protein